MPWRCAIQATSPRSSRRSAASSPASIPSRSATTSPPCRSGCIGITAPRRFDSLIITVFAALTLVLAFIGLYGVMAYRAAQRTRELGIRVALGAARGQVLELVLREGMGHALVGTALGLALALVLTRFMASLLFAVQPRDARTFAGPAGTLMVVAFASCLLPARRATRVDAVEALRAE
jgi:putative ABC transport system permease protein